MPCSPKKFGGTRVKSLYKELSENIDDIKFLILSRPPGYHPSGKPVISLTNFSGFENV
jgi:hypothetical protein